MKKNPDFLIEEDKRVFLFIQSIYDLGFCRHQVVKEPDGQTTTFIRGKDTITIKETDGNPSVWSYRGIERTLQDYPVMTEEILQELRNK